MSAPPESLVLRSSLTRSMSIVVRDKHHRRNGLQSSHQIRHQIQDPASTPYKARPAGPSPDQRARQRPAACHWSRTHLAANQSHILEQCLSIERPSSHQGPSFYSSHHKHFLQPPLGQHNLANRHRRIPHHSRRALPNLHRPRTPHGIHPRPSPSLRRRPRRRQIQPLRRQHHRRILRAQGSHLDRAEVATGYVGGRALLEAGDPIRPERGGSRDVDAG